MIGIDTLAPWDKQRPLGLFNGGSTEIPAFGCYEIYDSFRPDSADALVSGGGRTVLKVRQPTADNVANFGINGPVPLPAGQSDGFGTQDYPAYAAYDTANVPAFGEEWGPQNGSCLIKKGNKGLVIYGDQNGTIVRVSRNQATSASPTLALLSGTLDAADWRTNACIPGLGVIGSFSKTATADIYSVQAFAAAYKYQVLAAGAIVVNPIPFSYASGSVVRVANHNGIWVCQGPAINGLGYYVPVSGFYSSGATLDLTWGTPLMDVGGIFSSAADTLTVTAPLGANQMMFRAEFYVNVGASWSASSAFSGFEAYLLQGAGQRGFATDRVDPSDAASTTYTRSLVSFRDFYIQSGDTFKMRTVYYAGASGGVNVTGYVRFTPMTGQPVF